MNKKVNLKKAQSLL